MLMGCVPIHDLDPRRSASYVTAKCTKTFEWNFGDTAKMIQAKNEYRNVTVISMGI